MAQMVKEAATQMAGQIKYKKTSHKRGLVKGGV